MGVEEEMLIEKMVNASKAFKALYEGFAGREGSENNRYAPSFDKWLMKKCFYAGWEAAYGEKAPVLIAEVKAPGGVAETVWAIIDINKVTDRDMEKCEFENWETTYEDAKQASEMDLNGNGRKHIKVSKK
jgi:hypothetical protein